MVSAVILPSPLLGSAPYEPVAAQLSARPGWTARVAALPADPSDPQQVLASSVRSVEAGPDAVIAHSNAGYYLPALSAHTRAALVAMDAALPLGDCDDTPLAPTQFAGFVAGLPVDDGRLPPWPAWWPRADVERLFPSSGWFERVLVEAPRLRPSYFAGRLPVPAGWARGPRAYLAFGDTYAAELAFASRAGWVVEQVSGGHLEHLAHPDVVAATIVDLLGRLHGA